jgi:DNA primase
MTRAKYSDFVGKIQTDEFLELIEWSPEYEDGRGNLVGYCPFPENHQHGDTTGKFALHPEKKVYNCFVCGGGSWLDLLMQLKNLDDHTAESTLHDIASEYVKDDVEFVEDFMSAFAVGEQKRVVSLPYYNWRVLEKHPYAYEWGEEMGLARQTIEDFQVRYNGEAFKPSPGKGKYAEDPPHVGPAVLVPHTWSDQLVGWQTRWLGDRPDWCGKWTNTVDFPGNETLFGWDFLAREARELYLVESPKTVMRLVQCGLPAVATFGDSVSERQLRLLRRFPWLVLAPDNDKAGKNWLFRTFNGCTRYSTVVVVGPVSGEKSDLADLSDSELVEVLSKPFMPFSESDLNTLWL